MLEGSKALTNNTPLGGRRFTQHGTLSLHSFLPIIFAVCHHGVESVVCHYDFVYVCTVKFGLYFSKMFMKSVVSFE